MAAAAPVGHPTGFDVMADRITTYYGIVPGRDKVRLAYIAQVLLNCLTDLGSIAGKPVPEVIRDYKGNDLINYLIERGYLKDYNVHRGDHRPPRSAGDDDGEAAASSSSEDAAVAVGSAIPLGRREATEVGRGTADEVGRVLSGSELTTLRRDAYMLLQDILKSVHPDGDRAYLTYDSSRAFPPQSKYSVSAFVGDVSTIINTTDRVYARESAMVLIVHILDKMGYIGPLPDLTPGTTSTILEFFKSRAFSISVGLICVATPHIVSFMWGLPFPTLASIYAAVTGDIGRYVIGSASATIYLNRDTIRGAISYVYSRVAGRPVDIDNVQEVVQVVPAASAEAASAEAAPVEAAPVEAAAAAGDGVIYVSRSKALIVIEKVQRARSKIPKASRRDQRFNTKYVRLGEILEKLEEDHPKMTVADMEYLNNKISPFKSGGRNKLTVDKLESSSTSRKTRKNKKHSKSKKHSKGKSRKHSKSKKVVKKSGKSRRK